MLVLTIDIENPIYIYDKEGNRIAITLLTHHATKSRQARLGFEAPREHFTVVRSGAKKKEA